MITFNNLRVNSIQNNSGILKDKYTISLVFHEKLETSFGSINGEMNLLNTPKCRMKPESDEFCLNSIR